MTTPFANAQSTAWPWTTSRETAGSRNTGLTCVISTIFVTTETARQPSSDRDDQPGKSHRAIMAKMSKAP